jgi:hypothetical protein
MTRAAPLHSLDSLAILSNAVQTPPPLKGMANRWKTNTTCNLISAAPVTVFGGLLSAVYLLYPI